MTILSWLRRSRSRRTKIEAWARRHEMVDRAGPPSDGAEGSALQPLPGRAKDIVRQFGIADGAGEHERSNQGGDGCERLLVALALPGRAHSLAHPAGQVPQSCCKTLAHGSAL